MATTCKERLKNFYWKKNWKLIAAGVAILVLVIAALILIVIWRRGPKCESAPPLPYQPYTPPEKSNSTGADSGASYEQYQVDGLNKHNEYRAKHRVPPMTLDKDLNSKAIQCAQHYVGKNTIDHSCNIKNGAGENLYMHSRTDLSDSEYSIDATKQWYDEIKDYKYHSPGFSMGTGHFTQLVWKTSTKLGVGFAKGTGIAVIAALYEDHGNMQGAFPENVPKPSC